MACTCHPPGYNATPMTNMSQNAPPTTYHASHFLSTRMPLLFKDQNHPERSTSHYLSKACSFP